MIHITYDSWKAHNPEDDCWDDDDYDQQDFCDHDECDIDILTGRASCDRCGEAWWATDAQVAAEALRQAQYAEWEFTQRLEEERPWNRLKRWLAHSRLGSWWSDWRFRQQAARDFDDEVPF